MKPNFEILKYLYRDHETSHTSTSTRPYLTFATYISLFHKKSQSWVSFLLGHPVRRGEGARQTQSYITHGTQYCSCGCYQYLITCYQILLLNISLESECTIFMAFTIHLLVAQMTYQLGNLHHECVEVWAQGACLNTHLHVYTHHNVMYYISDW